MVTGTLAVNGCVVTFGTARRGRGRLRRLPETLGTVPNVTSTASVQTSY